MRCIESPLPIRNGRRPFITGRASTCRRADEQRNTRISIDDLYGSGRGRGRLCGTVRDTSNSGPDAGRNTADLPSDLVELLTPGPCTACQCRSNSRPVDAAISRCRGSSAQSVSPIHAAVHELRTANVPQADGRRRRLPNDSSHATIGRHPHSSSKLLQLGPLVASSRRWKRGYRRGDGWAGDGQAGAVCESMSSHNVTITDNLGPECRKR